jgi:flagellar protein FlaF
VTTSQQARSAYASAARPIRTSRGTEYEVFARITGRIISASRDAVGSFPALAAALHDNRRLWTILAADVAEDGNRLSSELRARIFYLAEFTQQHTRKVLAGNAKSDILVEINTAVMGGLRMERTAA